MVTKIHSQRRSQVVLEWVIAPDHTAKVIEVLEEIFPMTRFEWKDVQYPRAILIGRYVDNRRVSLLTINRWRSTAYGIVKALEMVSTTKPAIRFTDVIG